MLFHVNRDTLAGVLLGLFGAAVVVYAYLHYPIGAISRMGPGMFPTMLGAGLVAVSIAIIARSRLQEGHEIVVNGRAAIFIFAALALTAVAIELFGIVPALLILVTVSSAAIGGRSFLGNAIYSVLVTAGIVIIFKYIMNINLDLIRWPF